MMSTILDNTLNFKAKVTTNRDKKAYKKLEKIAGIAEDYARQYFLDCQTSIEKDLKMALKNDTKIGIVSKRLPKVISQLTIWNKNKLFHYKNAIYDTLNQFGNEWILNLICLEDGKSYIIASNEALLQSMQELLKGKINECYLECEGVWLRKEMIKLADKF